MARLVGKLTAIAVDRRKKSGRAGDGGGLYLSVAPGGSKSWVFLWTVRGKRREMGLGPYPALSLKLAREKAAECRRIVAEGRDPIQERSRRQHHSFGECADLYIASMEAKWRNEKHKYQWRQTLTADCKTIRQKPVATISNTDVFELLAAIWTTKTETASRLRGRIELVLDFAKAKGWREGENPARWRGNLQSVLPPRKRLVRGHLAAMDYQQVPKFLARLRALEAMAARALEFTILTAARTSEALKAKWPEFDLERGLWTVPMHRMKSGEEHVVPLSDPALKLLHQLYNIQQSDFVFPGLLKGKPLSDMAMEMLLRRMDVFDATVHGFRSAFRDWCGDETDFPREIAEAALAHKVGNSVEQAYRRAKAIEKRRKLMDAWAAFCESKGESSVIRLMR